MTRKLAGAGSFLFASCRDKATHFSVFSKENLKVQREVLAGLGLAIAIDPEPARQTFGTRFSKR